MVKSGMSSAELGQCYGKKWIQHLQYSCVLSICRLSSSVVCLEPQTHRYPKSITHSNTFKKLSGLAHAKWIWLGFFHSGWYWDKPGAVISSHWTWPPPSLYTRDGGKIEQRWRTRDIGSISGIGAGIWFETWGNFQESNAAWHSYHCMLRQEQHSFLVPMFVFIYLFLMQGLTMLPRLASNLWSSCLSLPSSWD
jgi:hypothetical protein